MRQPGYDTFGPQQPPEYDDEEYEYEPSGEFNMTPWIPVYNTKGKLLRIIPKRRYSND